MNNMNSLIDSAEGSKSKHNQGDCATMGNLS